MSTDEEEGILTKQMLKCFSGEFDVESIHTLKLQKLELRDISAIGECVCLERLDLSYNNVTRLYALAGLTTLSVVNLASNRLTSLEGLQSLDNLVSLNISGNLISSVDCLRSLSTLEKFQELWIKDDTRNLSNPMCTNTEYKKDVIAILPNLVTLDGERLSGKGSDFFAVCKELDSLIKARDAHLGKRGGRLSETGPWLQQDYWNDPAAKSFEKSNLCDAVDQLQALLGECKRVVQSADDKIQSLSQSETNTTDVQPISS